MIVNLEWLQVEDYPVKWLISEKGHVFGRVDTYDNENWFCVIGDNVIHDKYGFKYFNSQEKAQLAIESELCI